jgi:hypothetical protein
MPSAGAFPDYKIMNQLNMRVKHTVLYIISSLFACSVNAQQSEAAYKFLRFPSSARVNALGGNNVSLVENDVSLVFQNPSLLGPEMNKNMNVTYISYLADISVGSAVYAKMLTPLSAFAFGVNYVSYGSFKGYDEDEISTGDFNAKDIAVNGMYSRDLTNKLRGGVTAKVLLSNYEQYSSSAVGFDVGLSYFIEQTDFTVAVVAKNIGAQLSSYNEQRLALPWDLQVGMTRKLSHAPIRISLTAQYLNQWNFDRINAANEITDENQSFVPTLFKHMVLGVELLPSSNFWVGLGYNPKVHSDLKLETGNKWGGFNFGTGFRAKKISVGFALAKYYPSSTTYQFSLTMDLSKY